MALVVEHGEVAPGVEAPSPQQPERFLPIGKGARITRIGNPNEVLLQSESDFGLYQITQREFESQLGLSHTVCLVHTLNEDNAMASLFVRTCIG